MSKTIETIAHERGLTSLYKNAVGSRGTSVIESADISDADIASIAASRTIRQDGGKTRIVGAAVDVDYETGKITITVPTDATSDSAGYVRNKALQQAKKDLVRHRMAQRLAARRLAQAKVDGR